MVLTADGSVGLIFTRSLCSACLNTTLDSVFFTSENQRLMYNKSIFLPQTSRSLYCPVCFQRCTKSNTTSASCGHSFCDDCWMLYCATQLKIGLSSGMYNNFVTDILFMV